MDFVCGMEICNFTLVSFCPSSGFSQSSCKSGEENKSDTFAKNLSALESENMAALGLALMNVAKTLVRMDLEDSSGEKGKFVGSLFPNFV